MAKCVNVQILYMKKGEKKNLLLSYFFVKKISLSWRVGYVMDWWFSEWISERCMYVTPIRLDLLLNANQISCCIG